MATPDLGDLTCKEVVELVTDYLEGVLTAEMRGRFDRHLSACDPCVLYVDQMRRTIATLGKLPDDAISQTALDTLLHHFRGWPREQV
jgi:anti-sigma factor RsiW